MANFLSVLNILSFRLREKRLLPNSASCSIIIVEPDCKFKFKYPTHEAQCPFSWEYVYTMYQKSIAEKIKVLLNMDCLYNTQLKLLFYLIPQYNDCW